VNQLIYVQEGHGIVRSVQFERGKSKTAR